MSEPVYDQIADLQDILNQRQARLEAIEQALAEARKESEWRGEKLQSVAKFAARTALLEAAEKLDVFGGDAYTVEMVRRWLRSRAGEVK